MKKAIFLALLLCPPVSADQLGLHAHPAQQMQKLAEGAEAEEYAFSSCLIGTAGRYYAAKEDNEAVAELVIAACVAHVSKKREYLLSVYSLCDCVSDVGAQTRADNEIRKMLRNGRKTALEAIINFRLKLLPKTPPIKG